jgi:hypothetical protein
MTFNHGFVAMAYAALALHGCTTCSRPLAFEFPSWHQTPAGLVACTMVVFDSAAKSLPAGQAQCFLDVEETWRRELVADPVTGVPIFQRGSGFFFMTKQHYSDRNAELKVAERTVSGWTVDTIANDEDYFDVFGDSSSGRGAVIATTSEARWTHFFERTGSGWLKEDISSRGFPGITANGGASSLARLVVAEHFFVFMVPSRSAAGQPVRELTIGIRAESGNWQLVRQGMPLPIRYVAATSSGAEVFIAVSFSPSGWQIMRLTQQEIQPQILRELKSEGEVTVALAVQGNNLAAVTSDASTQQMEFVLLDAEQNAIAHELLPEKGTAPGLVFDSVDKVFRVAALSVNWPASEPITIQTRGPNGWVVERLKTDPVRMTGP